MYNILMFFNLNSSLCLAANYPQPFLCLDDDQPEWRAERGDVHPAAVRHYPRSVLLIQPDRHGRVQVYSITRYSEIPLLNG